MQHLDVCKKRVIGTLMPVTGLLNTKYRQAVRIMKITAFILLVCTLHVSAGGYSQAISLSEKDVPLTKVFSVIEKQTQFVFLYDVDMVKHGKNVTIAVKNMQLQQVLDLLFKDQPMSYLITGNIITVTRKKNDTRLQEEKTAVPPPIDIHGKVVDENGKPLPGVTITVKGTKKQTLTNENGEFSISDVPENAVLSFSSVNMEALEIIIGRQPEILAKLKTKTAELDEVQLVAYGQTTKRFQTGNVNTIKSSDIEKQPVSNPLLALQGRVPGLFITQNSGVPGGGVTVRIQGRNSIGFGNDPLYVIDGVPFFSQLPSTGVDAILGSSGGMVGTNANGNPLSYLNPGDIESISVLKDADATAIYGSRAANGAILISTKKGRAGQMKLDVNLQTGWGRVGNKWDMLNTRQYLDMRYEALRNDGIKLEDQTNTDARYYDLLFWDTTRYTDWQKTLIGGTARYTNMSASISGGSSNIQYLVNGNYRKETTVFPGDFNNQKGSVHFNLNGSSANQKLTMQFSGNFMLDKNRLPTTDLTKSSVLIEPVAPELYLSDGTLNWEPNSQGISTWNNPLAELFRKYKNRTTSLVSNLVIGYRILPGLQIRSSLGYTSIQTTDISATPNTYGKPEERVYNLRFAQYGNRNLNSWIFEPQLTYSKVIYKGKLEVLLGGTVQQNNSEAGSVTGIGYNNDDVMENLSAATQLFPGSQYLTEYKYAALFGRLNYNWAEKYIINLTGRRDGTSRFGEKNQFHNFGSVGGAWIFSQEKWLQNQKILTFGKLRASYGTTGSDQIGDYAFMSLYNYWSSTGLPYQNSTGIFAGSLPNPYLEWEETRKLQLGIDVGFLKERIVANVTYGLNRSSNQLLNVALPSTTGQTTFLTNLPASVENKSWEISFSSVNIKTKNLSWTTNINVTVPKNSVASFPKIEATNFASGFGGVIVGEPLGVIKSTHSLGVNPATGWYQYADKKGDPVTFPAFPDDYTVLLSTAPKYYGGLQNNLKFKGFELDVLFQFVKQLGQNHTLNNLTLLPGQFVGTSSNQPTSVLRRWQKTGDETNIGYFTTNYNGFQSSDHSFTDASYIRLKNISLSYQLPDKWLNRAQIRNCKFYMHGQNVLTITNWEGLDPETQNFYSLPPLRFWSFGIELGL